MNVLRKQTVRADYDVNLASLESAQIIALLRPIDEPRQRFHLQWVIGQTGAERLEVLVA